MSKIIVLAYSGGLDTTAMIPLLEGAPRRRRGGHAGRRRPRDRHRQAHGARQGGRRRRRRGGRRQGGVRPAVRAARPHGQRPLRREVSAGERALAAADRPQAGRGRAPLRGRGGGPRLHRQGQRPGARRDRRAQPGSAPRVPGAGPRLGHEPRRAARLLRGAQAARAAHQKEPLLDRREPLGTHQRVRPARRPLGGASRRRLRGHGERRGRARPGAARSRSASSAACR